MWTRGDGCWRWLALLIVIVALQSGAGATEPADVLDDFEALSGWSAISSPGATLTIAADAGPSGASMRLDVDFHGGGGYVIARKAFPVDLPDYYAFKFQMRGNVPTNDFQFKLVDRRGENVWWSNDYSFNFPADWEELTIKKARVRFAWGPAGENHPLRQLGYIEFAIAAEAGGKGSVWIDDLRLEAREPEARPDLRPKVTASSYVSDHEPERVLDPDSATGWHSEPAADPQWLLIDFLRQQDYGGLVIDWDADDYATAYQVQVSDNGATWRPVHTGTACNGGRSFIYLHDGESRYVRLDLEHSSRGHGYGIRQLTVKPYAFSASPNQFFEAVAAAAPAGIYPRYLSGKQTYWTLVGVNGDDKQALFNEEGMLEVDKGAFSVMPFLYVDGTLVTWSAVHTTQQLQGGYLPIPSVTWEHPRVDLKITAFAAGDPWASTLYARYRVVNHTDSPADVTLFLAVRPFQVLPPWQSLNMVGGVTPIRELAYEAPAVRVNHDKVVLALTPPDRFGAAPFEGGLARNFLSVGKLPGDTRVSDRFGYASGALQYRLSLAAGDHEDVDLAIPFHNPDAAAHGETKDVAAHVATQLEATTRAWERLLGRVEIDGPPAAAQVLRTLKTTLAYVLINRDGPAIQPGSRNYARSWIRDGAVTSTALLEMGFTEEVRDFIRWYARYQTAEGKVPCCVDHRGADPVPENDSNGEFVYTIAEYYRYTHDVGFLDTMWPAVVKAIDYITALRGQRLNDVYTRPETLKFHGLLPESISHEGYSSQPVHSYWDDFFALRGVKDAASLAAVMGDDEHAARFAALRDAFRKDLYASLSRVISEHQIDYIPGSAELADFDPTSTAVAVTLAGEQSHLPAANLQRTFEIYYDNLQTRLHSDMQGDGYTPYELRNVDVFVRLGQRQRALDVLEALLTGQRPQAWNEWAEVVWRDPTAARFIGDMPHTWVGSTFILSVRSMFAYEREADQALVLAAGLPSDWINSDSGVRVKRLPTHYGVLSYTLRAEGPNTLRFRLSGDLSLPPGNIVLQPPVPQPLQAVTVNGQAIQTFTADSATINEFPADVVLTY